MATRNEIRNLIREMGFDSLSAMNNSDKARLANKLRAESAAKGDKWIVSFKYPDPSGKGIASGKRSIHAPNKETAKRYAVADLRKEGKKIEVTRVQLSTVKSQSAGLVLSRFFLIDPKGDEKCPCCGSTKIRNVVSQGGTPWFSCRAGGKCPMSATPGAYFSIDGIIDIPALGKSCTISKNKKSYKNGRMVLLIIESNHVLGIS